jgi:hypothetical protein
VLDDTPRLGRVHLSKIAISDGFYCIWVNTDGVPKLGVMFPTRNGEGPLCGFPLDLPIGCMQSPPLFTATIKMVANLANNDLCNNVASVDHLLHMVSETQSIVAQDITGTMFGLEPHPIPAPLTCTCNPHPAIKMRDVYVDNFIGMTQGNQRHRRHVK